MKFLVVLAAVIVAISALTDIEQWEQFKKTHNKTYKNTLDESIRYGIFKKNLRDIVEHNNRYNNGAETYFKGMNKFGDWTKAEFRKLLNFKKPSHSSNTKFVRDPNFVAPESVDWRDSGAVLEVKDQGSCGSCWAFSTTGSIEGQNILKNNQRVSLSEQELVDCSIQYGNEGCDGGAMENAYEYIIDNGIATEEAYPYTGYDGRCQSTSKSSVTVTNFVDLDSTEDALLEGVASVGPIAIAVNADPLQFYYGGIINDRTCTSAVDHGVLAVGYGTEGNSPYWLIKNSWGSDWGESGYYKLVRNANQQCGVGSWNTYPILA